MTIHREKAFEKKVDIGTLQSHKAIKNNLKVHGTLAKIEDSFIEARLLMIENFKSLGTVKSLQNILMTTSNPLKIVLSGSSDGLNNFWRSPIVQKFNASSEWSEIEIGSLNNKDLENHVADLNKIAHDMPIFSQFAKIEITEVYVNVDFGELVGKTRYSADFAKFILGMVNTGEEDDDS